MFLHSASCELHNPPSVSWKSLFQELLVVALFIAVVSMFV